MKSINYQEFWNEAESVVDVLAGNDDELRYAIKKYATKNIVKYLLFNSEYVDGYIKRRSEAHVLENQITNSLSKYITLNYEKEKWQEVAGEINAEAEAELKRLQIEEEKQRRIEERRSMVESFYSDINKHAQNLLMSADFTKVWGNCFVDAKGIVRYMYKKDVDKCYKIIYERTDNPNFFLVIASDMDSSDAIDAGIIKKDFSEYKIFQNVGGYILEGIRQNRYAICSAQQ